MRTFKFLVALGYTAVVHGQTDSKITGYVLNAANNAIPNAFVQISGTSHKYFVNELGQFTFSTSLTGKQLLQIEAIDYQPKTFELILDGTPKDLGQLILYQDMALENSENLILLSDNELSDDEDLISGSMGLLQSTRDVFLTRAAFDFGQAFFKVRGYDSRNGIVMINGLPMNKALDGRPQWNNWGGLNDVFRNQTYSNGLEINSYAFGGILGNTNINLRPSKFRPGFRLSTSASNRTYKNRVMATYNSGQNDSGFSYSISTSRRWAQSGYVDGTLYDAYSLFGAIEYQISDSNSIVFGAFNAKNRRGRSPALTEEVAQLMGTQYNSYWGKQQGTIRNSREREINEPLFLASHFFQSDKLRWITGVYYQIGQTAKSRLGYYDAPNPDPTYYKYLPSYHINNSISADFNNANLAERSLVNDPQLNWEELYKANNNSIDGKASYLLYDDISAEKRAVAATSFHLSLPSNWALGFGAGLAQSRMENYARISDMLGAQYHLDEDPFTETYNNLRSETPAGYGNKIGYHYKLDYNDLNGFVQIQYDSSRFNMYSAASISSIEVKREGMFQNERFLENSFGDSETIKLPGFNVKGGARFFITGRHWFSLNASQLKRNPTPQNLFVNPRENNLVNPEITNELATSIDLNYFFSLPDFRGRVSSFFTRFQHTSDINFFFVDSGLGSDFVQEVLTGVDKLHKGIEWGLEYQASNQVKLTLVGNIGNYAYASNPNVEIYFDTAGEVDDLINTEGDADLGLANLKGLRLAQGPQTALAFGVEYRSPKYWWIGTTANLLDHNYANLSTIKRTQSFALDPETGQNASTASHDNVNQLLGQEKLDEIHLLNLVGGKSWLINKKYISAFVSINNLFDSTYRSGGYEQSRNGNYNQMVQDNLSGSPSFGPKYWYGYGRTYFLNLAINL
ncbi:TonB-dependent receptor [Muricauda sp. 2012CJ35-5]|uniref:TonB-dependent receptor n=1 Tax=Flagellimonas spongiicola TaxID=2942208 RepID=A0ABT0PUD8_9FLAO|nr:TonB-dependent receptor [Allomuricauda spongiicola]MCL6274048.1 TonB-dependent receptor [Allomuricauda spongiicola]